MADSKQPEGEAKKEPTKMEVGGTGTAKASFKDANGGEAKVRAVQWDSTNPLTVVVSQDEKDPLSAKIVAVGTGPASLVARGEGEEGGRASARIEIYVTDKGTVHSGEISLSVQPAPAKKEEAKAAA